MNHADVAPSVALGHYWEVVRRRWWMILVCTALGFGLALAYLSVVPRTATASASMALNVISTDPFNVNRAASGLIDSAAEAQIASSYAVAARAAEKLAGETTPEQLRGSVRVTGAADTAILQVTASAGTAAEARAAANAVATEFLAFRSEQAQNRIARTLDQSNQRLDQLREDLRQVDQQIAEAEADSVEETQAQSDRSLLALQINAVVTQAASASSIDTSGGQILSPAEGNPVRWSPQRELVLASGLCVGFGLGVIAAFAMGALTRRVRSARDVGQHGGRAVLGNLSQQAVTLPPSGEDLQELRAIRERLLADSQLDMRAGVLTFIDDSHTASEANVPVALAVVLAMSGHSVEYVSPPASSTEFSALASSLGLLGEPDPVPTGTRYTSQVVPSLTVFVPRTDDMAHVEEALSSSVAEGASTRQGLVVLGVRRDAGEAGRLAACRLADAVLMALVKGQSRTEDLARISKDARSMGAHVAGCVLVNRHRMLDTRSHSTGPRSDPPLPRLGDVQDLHIASTSD